jgi:transcriptional regulator with XRE-family HTH domain
MIYSLPSTRRCVLSRRNKYAEEYTNLVGALVELRLLRGLTQSDIASKIGLDQSLISKFERCERRMDMIDFIRYCQALELDPGKFLNKNFRTTKIIVVS